MNYEKNWKDLTLKNDFENQNTATFVEVINNFGRPADYVYDIVKKI